MPPPQIPPSFISPQLPGGGGGRDPDPKDFYTDSSPACRILILLSCPRLLTQLFKKYIYTVPLHMTKVFIMSNENLLVVVAVSLKNWTY